MNSIALKGYATDITAAPTGSVRGYSFKAAKSGGVAFGNVTVPQHTAGIIVASGSSDGIMIGVDTLGNIYSAFRNNGTWSSGGTNHAVNLSNDFKYVNYSKAVSAKTTTTLGTWSLGVGFWMVVSYMYLGSGGSGVYNHTVSNRTVRAPEENGGGSMNITFSDFRSAAGSITATTYVSNAQTVNVQLSAFRLA